jgi:hypothetical protein
MAVFLRNDDALGLGVGGVELELGLGEGLSATNALRARWTGLGLNPG